MSPGSLPTHLLPKPNHRNRPTPAISSPRTTSTFPNSLIMVPSCNLRSTTNLLHEVNHCKRPNAPDESLVHGRATAPRALHQARTAPPCHRPEPELAPLVRFRHLS